MYIRLRGESRDYYNSYIIIIYECAFAPLQLVCGSARDIAVRINGR